MVEDGRVTVLECEPPDTQPRVGTGRGALTVHPRDSVGTDFLRQRQASLQRSREKQGGKGRVIEDLKKKKKDVLFGRASRLGLS